MAESDFISLIYTAEGLASSLFQYWLSATFALAVVAHFAPTKVDGVMFKLASTIYLLATITFICGWFAYAFQIKEFIAMMHQQGYETTRVENIFGILHGVGILIVFVTGTCGVLYYVRWTLRHQSDNI